MTVTVTLKDLHVFIVGMFVAMLIACHPGIDRGLVALFLGMASALMILPRMFAALRD